MASAFLSSGIHAIGAASPTTDEPGHYRYGHRILRGVAARWDDSKMPISALNALPCWLSGKADPSAGDIDEFSGPCDWTLARLPSLLGGLVLGLAIFFWSRSLFGGAGGLISFGLFAADPNLIAHSSVITTDIFGALGVLVSLRAFSNWLKNPGIQQAGLAGVCVGAAFISKYTAAYLPVIFALAAVLSMKARVTAPSTRTQRAAGLAVMAGLALIVINLGFLGDETGTSLRDQRFESPQFRELRKIPVLSSVPLPVPRPFIEGLDRVFHRERNGGGSGNIYLLGELRNPGSEGFVTYFAVIGFFKTPIFTSLIVALAAWLLLRRGAPKWSADIIVLVTTVVVFCVYFSFLFRAQIGFRHFLVTLPPLFVLAGGVGPFLARKGVGITILGLGLCTSFISVAQHGDDPLSYFNELVDPARTYEIAADSNIEWGQSRGRIAAYLAGHPEVIEAPAKPFPGRIIVGANQLTGVVTRKRMEWLRESGLKPVGQVAFTHFLFDITREQSQQLRRSRGEPPRSGY